MASAELEMWLFLACVPACARMCLRCVCVRERGWERDIEAKAERGTQAGVSFTGEAAPWRPKADRDAFGMRGTLLRVLHRFSRTRTGFRIRVQGTKACFCFSASGSVTNAGELWTCPDVGSWRGWHLCSSPSASSSSVVRCEIQRLRITWNVLHQSARCVTAFDRCFPSWANRWKVLCPFKKKKVLNVWLQETLTVMEVVSQFHIFRPWVWLASMINPARAKRFKKTLASCLTFQEKQVAVDPISPSFQWFGVGGHVWAHVCVCCDPVSSGSTQVDQLREK